MASRMHPRLTVTGHAVVMASHLIAAVRRPTLGRPLAPLWSGCLSRGLATPGQKVVGHRAKPGDDMKGNGSDVEGKRSSPNLFVSSSH